MRPEEFKNVVNKYPTSYILQRYLFDPFPYCFEKQPDLYWEFRSEISKHLDVHVQDIDIVGSAKLGFSPVPDKYGKLFNIDSDIDVLIVSSKLFEDVWLKLLDFSNTVVGRTTKRGKNFNDLQRILFYGTIRLDKISNSFAFAKDWWVFFNTLSTKEKYGPRQIRAAIYKNWHFAYSYYGICIDNLRGCQ